MPVPKSCLSQKGVLIIFLRPSSVFAFECRSRMLALFGQGLSTLLSCPLKSALREPRTSHT